MNNSDLEDIKDKHVMNCLSELEHASLEVELLQNPRLSDELKIHEDLVRGVQYAGELELREVLDKLHYNHVRTNPAKINLTHILYYVLGGILIIGIVAFLFLNHKEEKQINTKSIFASYYTPYQPSLQDRGRSLDENINIFYKAYLSKDHKTSLVIIKPLQQEITNDIKLMAAISANEEDELALSEKLLDEIIESKDYYFLDHALWYKALIKLKAGEISEALDILNTLVKNPKADHHKEAKDLIFELES